MFDDHIMNGGRKVSRRPNLSVYDNRKPPAGGADPAYDAVYAGRFDSDAPRTWAQDKALLVALGVNGEVPLAQARVNCGLDEPTPDPEGGFWVPRWLVPKVLRMLDIPANDNTKSAAIAA